MLLAIPIGGLCGYGVYHFLESRKSGEPDKDRQALAREKRDKETDRRDGEGQRPGPNPRDVPPPKRDDKEPPRPKEDGPQPQPGPRAPSGVWKAGPGAPEGQEVSKTKPRSTPGDGITKAKPRTPEGVDETKAIPAAVATAAEKVELVKDSLKWSNYEIGDGIDVGFAEGVVKANETVTHVMVTITIYKKDKNGEEIKVKSLSMDTDGLKKGEKWRFRLRLGYTYTPEFGYSFKLSKLEAR
jgi:hypothetical protein